VKTQQVGTESNARERQNGGQERHSATWKAAVFVLAGVLAAFAFAGCTQQGDEKIEPAPGQADDAASPGPIASLPGGTIDPGRYVFISFDPGLDASHRITIDVANGYQGIEGWAALKSGTNQTAVSTMAISDVYADACQWEGTLLDRSEISSTDEVVAAVATQEGLRVSTPTDVTVDGFAGAYMERRVPARTELSDCDGAQFRVYLDGRGSSGGERYLVPGELQRLWILDIEGVPLVIDASLNPGTSAQVRAELLQMVESIQIDPR
jgi:hypothetical protein